MSRNYEFKTALEKILNAISELNSRVELLERYRATDITRLGIGGGGDTAPTADQNPKKMTVQLLAAPPANADYITVTKNRVGGDDYYIVIEDA